MSMHKPTNDYVHLAPGEKELNRLAEELTRESVSRWAIISDEAWDAVPEHEERRFLRDAVNTACGIADLSAGILTLPMTVGYGNVNTCHHLIAVTCLEQERDFPPIWLWRFEQADDHGRHWVYNLIEPLWRPATDNQIRAYLLSRLLGKGNFTRARDLRR